MSIPKDAVRTNLPTYLTVGSASDTQSKRMKSRSKIVIVIVVATVILIVMATVIVRV